MKRLMVSITPDIEESIDLIKQKEFYNKSYAELYRQIIKEGIKVVKEKYQIKF